MAKRTELDPHFFSLWEDHRREQLEGGYARSSNVHPSVEKRADEVSERLEELRELYLRDRNPVLVWIAIQNIELANHIRKEPVPFPSWVLAYLFTAAAAIGGMAASWPEEPKKKEDQVGDCYFAEAEERTNLAITALRFRSKGKNPFVAAHRRYKGSLLLQKQAKQMQKGLSKKDAAESIEDPMLTYVDDKPRKLSRIGRKYKR